MNAQRSVWSPPPTKAAQKYATYLGGHFQDTRYTRRKPRIRLWWTDAEMQRLAYRELSIPDELADLLHNLYDQGARGLPPLLASVTHDNMILFFDVFFIGANITDPFAFYVVCDPNSVLRYGLVRLPYGFSEFPSGGSFIKYPPLWTWDGRHVWFFLEHQYDVFTCQLDTIDGTIRNLTQLFDGYILRDSSNRWIEVYECDSVGWVATDPRIPRAVFANIAFCTNDPENYVVRCTTLRSKYLPDGPEPIVLTDLGEVFTIMLGTFPVGPVAMFYIDKGRLDQDGSVHIVVGDRVAVTIPLIMSHYPDYFATTNTGLPYDLALTSYVGYMERQLWLLRYDGRIATIFFRDTVFLDQYFTGDPIDVVIEYDVNTGRAVKDIVVPAISPMWGMEHNGTILAVPMTTSSTGRVKLP